MNTSEKSESTLDALKDTLAVQAEKIRELEKKADSILEGSYDLEQYRSLLEQKAQTLIALPEEAEPFLSRIPDQTRGSVEQRLNSFAHNAEQALSIGSVFFMRQLLYPEDYREGQANDLERFIQNLK